MTREERIRWCIEQAEEFEALMEPVTDPHMWDTPRMLAQFWRDLAERLAA